MTEKNLSSSNFQTFFVSKETSICPMIIDIIRFGKKLDGIIDKNFDCSISLSYGKRVIITANNVNAKQINQEDIVEIIDYDPIKNNTLIIGKKNPSFETPVHWIIQKARTDVNAVVEISSKYLYEQNCNNLPVTDDIATIGTIKRVKNILKTLQKSKIICIKNEGLLVVGLHLKEIEDSLIKTIGGSI